MQFQELKYAVGNPELLPIPLTFTTPISLEDQYEMIDLH
jgi:hypothetical protein